MNNSNEVQKESWWRKVSELSRLGSGSACRSVYPYAALWGELISANGSSDEYAIPWASHISPVYHDYQDTILIVNSGEKSVSSSAGHELMSALPYADTRYTQAKNNLNTLIDAMSVEKGTNQFISICESEALQLHALMMSGEKPYILIEANTISIIKEVWRFRKATGIPVCFTLDACPNVHLLYPAIFKEPVLEWIKCELIRFCADGNYILDQVGSGPEKL